MAWPHVFGGLSGNVPASYLDDNFNAAAPFADFLSLAVQVQAIPSNSVPLGFVASGAAGTSPVCSRSDHQHPPQAAAANLQTGTSYTLLASDNGGVVEFTNAAAITVTVPALGAGFSCLLVQTGAGQVSFVGSGVTLRQASSFAKLRAQWSTATVYIRANGTDAVLSGDMAA